MRCGGVALAMWASWNKDAAGQKQLGDLCYQDHEWLTIEVGLLDIY